MKTYIVTGLREYWDFKTIEVKAASEKAAKAKFRKRIKGACTGLTARIKTP